MERYELNLQRHFQSLVRMERVSWNLANAGAKVDFALFASIRFFLQRCLFYLITTLKKLRERKVRVFVQVIFSKKKSYILIEFLILKSELT